MMISPKWRDWRGPHLRNVKSFYPRQTKSSWAHRFGLKLIGDSHCDTNSLALSDWHIHDSLVNFVSNEILRRGIVFVQDRTPVQFSGCHFPAF